MAVRSDIEPTSRTGKKPSLANLGDLQNVAHLRPGPVDRVRRQFQHACCFQRNLGHAEWPKMLFHVNHLSLFTQKDKIDRKEHSDAVHAPRWDDPEPAAESRPALGFSQ